MQAILRVLVVVLVFAQALPAFSAVQRRDQAMNESCAMMAHRLNDQPCVAAPCPCDHGDDARLMLAGAAAAVLEARAAGLAVVRGRLPRPDDTAARPGHPFPIDRPPTAACPC